MAASPRRSTLLKAQPPRTQAQTQSLARCLPRLAVLAWLWVALTVALMGVSFVSTSQAQDLNSLINDTPTTSSGNAHTAPKQPQIAPTPTATAISGSPAGNQNQTTPQGQASASQNSEPTGDQESFTPANRCPRCALFSAVQKADTGSSCQAVIFQGAPSFSVTGDFETSDTLEISASNSCRLSFFNDSPNRSIVLKLDRALRDLILAPSPDLYSGYLLAPRSSIDLIIRSGQLARSIEAKNIVTWEDAQQVGSADDSLFTIRVTPN